MPPVLSLSAAPSPALSPLEGLPGTPAAWLPDAPVLGLPLLELGALEPALPLLPDELGPLAPELPLLELEPELLLELDELLELGELDPLDAGEEAPELEGEEGGVGTEGVVGVLAEGQPINVNNTPTNAPVASQRTSLG